MKAYCWTERRKSVESVLSEDNSYELETLKEAK
jgi:hypothetical protein